MNKNDRGYVICVTPTGSDLPFVPNVEHIRRSDSSDLPNRAAPRIHEDGCDDFCSKCDAGCTASVADKTSEAGRYMVFTDSPYVRDAQIYCGTIDEDIYSEENEDNWYDTSGPVLLVDRDFKTLDELRKTVLNIYPDMDLCTLRAIRVSAETVCL